MSQNAPTGKNTDLGPNPSCQRRCASADCVRQAGRKESPNSERAAGRRAQQRWHPALIAEERKVHLLSSISSASPLFAVRKCSHSCYSCLAFLASSPLQRVQGTIEAFLFLSLFPLISSIPTTPTGVIVPWTRSQSKELLLRGQRVLDERGREPAAG